MRRLMGLAAAASLFAGVASAAETPAKPAEPPHVDISKVAMPIVWQGRLINYVFVGVRLMLTPKADPAKLMEKEPFFRDALVRAGHQTPFVKPWDFTHVDEGALRGVMMREVTRIAGPGQVKDVVVESQTPRQTVGLPKPPGAASPAPARPAES